MDANRSTRSAVLGWTAVVATVVGYDVWALVSNRETLSGAFWRARHHPHARYVAVGIWCGVTWHLLLGDKRVASERMSAAYRRSHPLWVLNERLKAHSAQIYDDRPLLSVSAGGMG